MAGLTYLITGANRGLGKGLLEIFAAREETVVIAAVRDVEKSTQDLSSMPTGKGSKLIIVKIDATSDSDPSSAVAELESKHGIAKVDIVIANSGLMSPIAVTLDTPPQDVRSQLEVNALGPLKLIQAFFPLLIKSKDPKFLVISSTVGSIGDMMPVPFFGYGLSKAAVNYLVRKLHFENPALTAMALNPGWVQTSMGDGAARGVGIDAAPMTLEESVGKLAGLVDGASREKSGSFVDVSGEVLAW